MKIYLVAGGIIVALLAGALLYFRPSSVPAINPVHEQRAAERELAVDAKDAAIRGLSAEITKLRAEADRQGQARAQAEQRASAFAGRAAELGEQVARLEAAAKARPPIDSRARALQVLRDLGY